MAEYIEREAALNAINENKSSTELAWITVSKIPAADVVPVVRGKWLNIDGDYTFASCSICSEDYEVATEEEAERGLWGAFLSAYRYCPNCGAKMDEVSGDE